jgi:hypothetical protein
MNEREKFLFCSAGGASESSPQRQLWETNRNVTSPGRGERIGFLSQFISVAPTELRFFGKPTHGYRRGLLSNATPWLKLK